VSAVALIAPTFPRGQTRSSPQHLLLTLFGDYWIGRVEALPSAALVALLGEFGVSQVSARAALARLARRGLLELSRAGRHTSYSLSDRAATVLDEGIRHILTFGAVDPTWSGRWTLAAFSVPEEHRDLRHALRTRLGWLGFAPLYDGLWVSPHYRAGDAGRVLDELGISTATLFQARISGDSPTGGDPIQAWDLETLREQYGQLCDEYAPVAARLRAGAIGPAEALTIRTAFMDAWRTMPTIDPDLPADLLPPGWPRSPARALFIELYDGLAGLSEQRVVQVVGRFDTDLARLVRSHTSVAVRPAPRPRHP